MSDEKVVQIVDEIEMKLLNMDSTEVKSEIIGKLVLEQLKNLDPIAYMRFASVYKKFDSIDQFIEEIKALKK